MGDIRKSGVVVGELVVVKEKTQRHTLERRDEDNVDMVDDEDEDENTSELSGSFLGPEETAEERLSP